RLHGDGDRLRARPQDAVELGDRRLRRRRQHRAERGADPALRHDRRRHRDRRRLRGAVPRHDRLLPARVLRRLPVAPRAARGAGGGRAERGRERAARAASGGGAARPPVPGRARPARLLPARRARAPAPARARGAVARHPPRAADRTAAPPADGRVPICQAVRNERTIAVAPTTAAAARTSLSKTTPGRSRHQTNAGPGARSTPRTAGRTAPERRRNGRASTLAARLTVSLPVRTSERSTSAWRLRASAGCRYGS